MKIIISSFSLLFLSILFQSCLSGSQGENTDSFQNHENMDSNNNSSAQDGTANETAQIIYFDVFDSRNGMVSERFPLPSTWKQMNDGKLAFTGPNGIKVHLDKGAYFMFTNDPYFAQLYQQSGTTMTPPKSIEEVVQQDFVTYANSINRKMIANYSLPAIAALDKNMDSRFYQAVPTQKAFNAMGMEWQDADGQTFLTVLHHNISYSENLVNWGYSYSILEAPKEYFQEAKQHYFNALLNRQVNPQWLAYVNGQDAQMAAQSNAGHQQRMNDIQAFGDRNTANHNSRMAAMDQNMENWRANQTAGDKNQEQFIDYINENTNVTDPNTGQTYKVEAGSKQYWMNSQGEYIKSDNSLYNPNLDDNVNNQTWTEYNEE